MMEALPDLIMGMTIGFFLGIGLGWRERGIHDRVRKRFTDDA